VIFLTVGTHEPFDRLVRAVDDWVAATGREDVFGQIAHQDQTGYHPTNFEWVAQLSPDDFRRRMQEAEFVVSHAGMGSIITALSLGTPIVVLPRRGHLRETRNDHQYATARQLAGRPGVAVAMTEHELPALLDAVLGARIADAAQQVLSPFAGPELIEAVRQFVQGPAGGH
jgi:UDP-N-acetylglucosamine transferase subunit ALG13